MQTHDSAMLQCSGSDSDTSAGASAVDIVSGTNRWMTGTKRWICGQPQASANTHAADAQCVNSVFSGTNAWLGCLRKGPQVPRTAIAKLCVIWLSVKETVGVLLREIL